MMLNPVPALWRKTLLWKDTEQMENWGRKAEKAQSRACAYYALKKVTSNRNKSMKTSAIVEVEVKI